MGYPKPPSGSLSGSDGTMVRQGSAGHLGWNPYASDDPDEDRRRNENPNTGSYFSEYDEENPPSCGVE